VGDLQEQKKKKLPKKLPRSFAAYLNSRSFAAYLN